MCLGNSKSLDISERNSYIENSWHGTFKETLHIKEREISAWQAKVQQAIHMGKMLFKDIETQTLFNNFQHELTENSISGFERNRKKVFKLIMIMVIGLLVWSLIMAFI